MNEGHTYFATPATEKDLPRARSLDPAIVNLARGMLLQAFRDVLCEGRFSRNRCSWQDDAAHWFFSDEYHPASFSWVCDILGLEFGSLRRWLLIYRQSPPAEKKKMARRLLLSLSRPHA